MAMRRIQVNVSEMSRIIVVRPVDGITINWGRVGELRHIACLPLEIGPMPPKGGQSCAEHDQKTRG